MNRLAKFKYILFFLFLVLIMGIPFSVYSYKKANEDRILFNVVFLGESVKGKTREEIKDIYLKKIGSYSLLASHNGLSKEYSLKDLGINLDYSKIENELFLHNRITLVDLINNPHFYSGKKVISHRLLLPDNLKISDKNYIIKSAEGRNFYYISELSADVNKERLINFLSKDLESLGVNFEGWDGGSAEFRQLQKILENDLEIVLGARKVYLGEVDKVKFLDIKSGNVAINEEKLNTFFEIDLLPRLNMPPIDRVVRVENREREIETYAGEKGFLVDADSLQKDLLLAFKNGQTRVVAKGEETEPQTRYEYVVVPDWSKKIVINLSTQTLVAYEGEEEVFRDIISSGKSITPTPLGTYYVYGKTAIQGMRGPNYYLPNVRWITWFYGDYAIHGTYWHNNFGTPMSRGCVNMTNQSAQFIYDWIKIGNPVLVVN